MGEKEIDEVENGMRRKMLKKAAFIVPTVMTFEIQSLHAEASSKWNRRRPPAPK